MFKTMLLATIFVISCKEMQQQVSQEKFKTLIGGKCFLDDYEKYFAHLEKIGKGELKRQLKGEEKSKRKGGKTPVLSSIKELREIYCPHSYNNLSNLLIGKVHKDESWYRPDQKSGEGWLIVYAFAGCQDHIGKAEKKELENAISRYLHLWLAPVRPIATAPIVDHFYYKEGKIDGSWIEYRGDQKPHLYIAFHCKSDHTPMTFLSRRESPEIRMFYQSAYSIQTSLLLHKTEYVKLLTHKESYNMSTLLHEIGHTFGLADTYVDSTDYLLPGQTLSVMSGQVFFSPDKTPTTEGNSYSQ